MRQIYVLLLFVFAFSVHSKAQVVINEFTAANKSDYMAANGKYYDWIELYNTTGSAINIGGWYLSDNPAVLNKYQIPAGISIGGNSFTLFFCSGKNAVVSGQYHTNFKLTQSDSSENIILSNAALTIIDSLTVLNCVV